jgi:hypothetical protein
MRGLLPLQLITVHNFQFGENSIGVRIGSLGFLAAFPQDCAGVVMGLWTMFEAAGGPRVRMLMLMLSGDLGC